MTSASVVLITGLMAAGKSSVAQGLAEQFPKSVHVRGDLFRRMIVGGRAEMDVDLSAEAYEQLRLRYRIAATVADLYLQAGFTVVYQDMILGQDLADVVQYYRQHPLFVVVLCPRPDVVAGRESGRAKAGYSNLADIAAFDRMLHDGTPRIGLWLDSSSLTLPETVAQILARLEEARV